ncbi:unnamed protein product, partial [Urochloa humidicola]
STARRAVPLATLPAAQSGSSRRGSNRARRGYGGVDEGAGEGRGLRHQRNASADAAALRAEVNGLQLGLLVRAEEKRVENLIHHHVIHYHLHFQRRKLIRLEMMDRWPYQLQMALADIVPHLRDKGRKDSLKIRDEIADSLVELHKD